MSTHLGQSVKSILGKLIMLLLAAMFIMWGIGDVFRNMITGRSDVATVGKVTITTQQFHSALQHTHQSPEQTLAGLINDALIAQEENALGIAVTDDQVANYIRTLPEFHGKDGQFDKNVYQALLANAQKSEAEFVNDVRREMGAKLLIGTFAENIPVPEVMVHALYKLQEEQRVANLVFIPALSVASKVAVPTDQEIKVYYDTHPKEFSIPEYRTLSYVTLPLSDVQSKITVTPEELKQAYAEHKDEFRQPERRDIKDLQFDNEQDAKAAAAKLASGIHFTEVAAAAPIANKGKIALGLKSEQELPADAGEPVFALKENENTQPLLVDFSWHIYQVSKIVPQRTDSFEEARTAITADITARQSQDTAQKMMNGFEDALAGGATLEAAAEKIGQKIHRLEPLQHDGIMADGTKAEFPPYDNFLNVAFATTEKDHSQAIQAPDGSYFLVRVDNVAPEHIRPLAEVKAQVVKAALAEKTQAKLAQIADGISEKLRAGASVTDALAANGVSAQFAISGNLKRGSEKVPSGLLEGKLLPRGLTRELFHLKGHEATHAYPAEENSYMIAVLTQIIPAPDNAPAKATDEIREKFKTTFTDEVLHNYLHYLREKYPLSVNMAALGTKNEGSGE